MRSDLTGGEEASECVLGEVGRPLVLPLEGLSLSPASPCLVMEGTLQERGPLWEPSLFWGVGPTVVLDSFGEV